VLEQSLLASVEGHNANKSARVNDERINDLVNQLSTKIWYLREALLYHPSKDVLGTEYNRILEELREYRSIEREERKHWLKTSLPAILQDLLHKGCCQIMDCPRLTDLPDDHTLEEWTAKSISDLRFEILAHHHGSSYSAVRDRFNRRIPRRYKKIC
jgi:hypothetical protein